MRKTASEEVKTFAPQPIANAASKLVRSLVEGKRMDVVPNKEQEVVTTVSVTVTTELRRKES